MQQNKTRMNKTNKRDQHVCIQESEKTDVIE